MKIKLFVIAAITFLVFLFSFGNFSVKPNDVFAASTSIISVQGGDYEYVRVFQDGIWWIYVYDGGDLIDAYPEDE
jgi:hypothetical protein